MLQRTTCEIRGTKDYGMSRWGRRSVRFGTGELDHLGPLLCLVRDELAEVGGRKRKHRAAQFGDPRLQLRIDESCIDLLVELLDDLGGCVLGRAHAKKGAR